MSAMQDELHIMLVAGESSGDILGAELMVALREQAAPRIIRFSGVGGPRMEKEGLSSIFPMSDIAVMGPREIAPRLPLIFRRIWQTVRHAVDTSPDILVGIDSPEFTHMVARRVAKRVPEIPIVNYVLPSVWAWRQGRARAMRSYIRRVLALLPFEPAFMQIVGVDCVYVGHPATSRIPAIEAGASFRAARGWSHDEPVLLLLPGSRVNEVKHLIDIFGDVVSEVIKEMPSLKIVLPTVPHVRDLVVKAAQDWPVSVEIVESDEDRRAAFSAATAALAASGTVALELGLARVPMVIAYRAEALVGWFALNVLKIPSVVLINLILDRPSVREYLQGDCTAEKLKSGLMPLLTETPERERALRDLDEFRERMSTGEEKPSVMAAKAVLEVLPK